MPEVVYRTLVEACPVGTNLGLLHLLWMLVSGRRYLDLTELGNEDTLGTIAQREEATMALVG